ncbi:membrane protein insertase YidC [Puia sp.]|uniref:membrane protein insertase YidC n=1 Tax=Puia sp. TaxID=2045100 RepID=UPI002F420C84
MDRNTIIGFVLLGLLLFVYLYINTKSSHELEAQRKHIADSVAVVTKAREAAAERVREAAVKPDSSTVAPAVVDTTGFNPAFKGTEQLVTVENDLVKVVFSNKGGQPVDVELKKFKSYDSTPVKLVGPNSRISYPINTGSGVADIAELYFKPGQVVKNADGSQTVRFRLPTPAGEAIEHEYTLPANDYMLDWNVNVINPEKLFSQNNFNIGWHIEAQRAQNNISEERRLTSIGFYEDNRFDYMSSKNERTFEKPVEWVSVSQQFFNTTLVAKSGFSAGSVKWQRETADSSNIVARGEIALQAKVPATANANLQLRLYYGPNDFSILDKEEPGMTHIIDLGRGIYSFVRPVNVYVLMPVFNFFKRYISSFGIAILLLTLFIRLFTSPLVYSSYLSGAKMKALRPEIEAMKKRVGGDQQQMGMEQMKLFREAGVNPLGGCIPALLQIPIFFALYSFFSSNIGLRGEHFLWSHDLSSFDSILHFGFSIPGYGDHVSLFALCAVATSFLISLYGMSMTPDQSNPAMKYMPYIMPVFLLVFFNRLASALTWYYTVSNVITLALQFVIQHYIIDHTKILAKLQENRTKPKTKSKWQERLEQMQEAQKDAQKRPQPPRK